MTICENCEKRECFFKSHIVVSCPQYKAKDKGKVQTNADRIRAMTDEELRDFLCSITKCEVCRFETWGGCELLTWLQQPVEGE